MYLDDDGRSEGVVVGSAPVAGSGGFFFDLPGVEAAIRDWTRLENDLREDATIARPLGEVVGPGQESASTGMASSATLSGDAFMSHHRTMRKIVEDYLIYLTDARNEYVAREDAGRDTFRGGQL